jgi:beta-galactosidase
MRRSDRENGMPHRSPFKLTYDSTRFFRDGQPHQILSGSVSYFRTLPEQWPDRLEKLVALGCNTVELYVPWNLHEPRKGTYDFSDRLDLEHYLDLASEAGVDVILRPGPYICAEWEFGGLPWWLLTERDLDLRCSDPGFLEYVDRWWGHLLPRILPYQSTRGGPVVACQVENEYGYYGYDVAYLEHLRDRLRELGVDVMLFTSDGTYGPEQQRHGGLPDLLRTANFGSAPEARFAELKKAQPEGPMACMEFWVGWFDLWGNEAKSQRDPDSVVTDLTWMLEKGASVNFFVFHGGTSFGFTSGANLADRYDPTVTSYDYDGLLTECGDLTPKYLACREAIARHTGRTDLDRTFAPAPRLPAHTVPLAESVSLLDAADDLAAPVCSPQPRSIEQLGEGYGYVLYRARIPASFGDRPMRLRGMHDFAHVLADGTSLGTWYRNDPQPAWTLPFNGPHADVDIVVDCMARPNFGHCLGERKGITEGVFFGDTRHEERAHFGWTCYALPMTDLSRLTWGSEAPADGPRFYRGWLEADTPADTFLALPGFTKGFAMVNGFNLGRYWAVGPQHSLYVPAPLLRKGLNELVVFEVVGCRQPTAELVEEPVWTLPGAGTAEGDQSR